MKITSPSLLRAAAVLLCLLLTSACQGPNGNSTAIAGSTASDPLPSWAEGPTRSTILEFVAKVTEPGGMGYVPPEERIATFDNDGTLWCEQPVVQIAFAMHRINAMAPEHPDWKDEQPFKSVLEGDEQYLVNDLMKGGHELLKILALTHSGMPASEFEPLVKSFLKVVKHPRYGVPFTATTYLPMLELLEFLRASGFKTYLCSGGGVDFMRAFSEGTYGVVPENVIGSYARNTFEEVHGKWVLIKGSADLFNNDKANKAVGIDQRIGRIPILAAGNVRSGGDVGQLRYSQTNAHPSLQLMINHDDAKREFAYAERGNESLNAARENGWVVVSMKRDWLRIFAHDAPAANKD